MFLRKKLWNKPDFDQPDETKWDNRFFLLFGPFRDTISPIIILQSMIRDNHKTWFRHIYDSLLSNFWRLSTILILLTDFNSWQIDDKLVTNCWQTIKRPRNSGHSSREVTNISRHGIKSLLRLLTNTWFVLNAYHMV